LLWLVLLEERIHWLREMHVVWARDGLQLRERNQDGRSVALWDEGSRDV